MIELVKLSINIGAPVGAVYRYATNLEHYGDWFPGVISVTSANQNDHATVGKTYLERLELPMGTADILIEVVQCQPDQLFMSQGNLDGILPQMTMSFSSNAEDGCLLTLQYHSRNPSLTESTDWVMDLKRDLNARAKAGLEALKHKLEFKNALSRESI